MQVYPNYYSQPNNYGQFNPQQPYIDRLNQLQQYQQNLQMPSAQMQGASQQFSTLGKIVDSVDVVKATDIPMDGNLYYFPKADGTEIYAKQWLNNGTTRILAFKPVLESGPNYLPETEEKLKIGLSDEATEAFMKRFDDLEKRLDDFEISLNKSSAKSLTSRAKKEVISDE